MTVRLEKWTAAVVLIVMLAGMICVPGTETVYAESGTVIDGGTVLSDSTSACEVIDGGTVLSDSTSACEVIDGGKVLSDGTNADEVFGTHAEYSADTNTITLNDDISLKSPVIFMRRDVTGYDGKTITLDLNGHSITGAPGTDGSSPEDTEGKNAIELIAADLSLVIKGPGKVTGGKGAVYESGSHAKSGSRGGMAVCLPGGEYHEVWYPALSGTDRLEHGITVTGGAVLTGGAGGDVTGSDLMYNIENYSGERGAGGSPGLAAGNGGAGMGQEFCSDKLAFARVIVENGAVTGGAGGDIDASMLTLTQYGIMNQQAVINYMKGKSLDNYDWDINYMLKLTVGNGGDGISIGAGRKYVRIDKHAVVTGGRCGSVDHGSSSLVNQIDKSDLPEAGDGISVNAGDIGLTNKKAGYTGDDWKTKGPDSDDMGIYVAGTVSGGDTPDSDAMNDSALNGGRGIFLNGDAGRYGIDEDYYPQGEYPREWGIIDIEGTVTGGNGGSAVCGSAGRGGSGIAEHFNQDYGYYGTSYYIVNGLVSGGNGGSSMQDEKFGYGENGINILYNYREGLNIAGNGTVSGGDSGSFTDRNGTGANDYKAEAVRLYKSSDTNRVDVSQVSGDAPQAVKKNKISVTAGMTGFSSHPTTSTKLSCSFDKPDGYDGKVYISWYIIMHGALYDDEVFNIESSSLDLTDLNLLSNSAYRFLAYKKNSGDYFYRYNADVMTADRIKENNENNHTSSEIYCTVMLEDGRWGRSGTMKFDRNGWKGNSTDKDKKVNPLNVNGKTATVRYSKVRKAAQKLKVTKVIKFGNKGKGTLSYTKVSGSKKITVNKKTGKVTVKKGTRKGTYKVTVKVRAAGDSTYKPSGAKRVTFRIRIK